MSMSKEEYREYLQGLSYEELFGQDWVESEVEDEIESRLDEMRDDLESLDYEELLGEAYLEELAEEEIEKRVEAFEEKGL
jgi:hypothetical protein